MEENKKKPAEEEQKAPETSPEEKQNEPKPDEKKADEPKNEGEKPDEPAKPDEKSEEQPKDDSKPENASDEKDEEILRLKTQISAMQSGDGRMFSDLGEQLGRTIMESWQKIVLD